MKKETLLEIILGTIGGIVFGIGMCMFLLPEWNLFTQGVVVAIIGFVILICIIPIYRKEHPKKVSNKKTDFGLVLTWTIGVVGSLIMGFGMSIIMVGEASSSDMLVGIITGVVGLVICVLNYPIYAYIKTNKR